MKIYEGLELTVINSESGKERISCTAEKGENLILRLRLERSLGVVEIQARMELDGVREDVRYFEVVKRLYDSDELNGRKSTEEISFKWKRCEFGVDIYEAEWTASADGLYYLRAMLLLGEGCLHREYQMTVFCKGASVPEWLSNGIMYQIFPDRFAKSDKYGVYVKPYGVLNQDWYDGIPKYPQKPGDALDNNEFFGGSLYGVIEKLDYLASLNVSVIYLNPIFEAYSNHKYDTADYTKVDKAFGGDEALDLLISECEKRGMRIILDGVFNHTGSDSVYFNAFGRYPSVGAAQGLNSEYADWYRFKKYPEDYDCWWGVKILPTLNKNSESLRNFISGENGVIRHWLKKGISGWRLDVADELPDSFISEIRYAAKSEKSDSVVLGEVWEDASNKIAYGERRKYFSGYELDSVMNYPFRSAIIDFTLDGDSEAFGYSIAKQCVHYPEHILNAQMNFLGTHDTERILCVLSGADVSQLDNAFLSVRKLTKEERELAIKRLKFASALMYCLPGIPCIYYGDEVGMEGWRDPFNRRPFPWGKEEKELYEHYKRLGEIRSGTDDLKGDTEIISSDGGVFIMRRENAFVVANRSGKEFVLRLCEPFKELINRVEAELCCDGKYEYRIAELTVAVIVMK